MSIFFRTRTQILTPNAPVILAARPSEFSVSEVMKRGENAKRTTIQNVPMVFPAIYIEQLHNVTCYMQLDYPWLSQKIDVIPERNEGDDGPGRISSGDLSRKRLETFQTIQDIMHIEIKVRGGTVSVSIRSGV